MTTTAAGTSAAPPPPPRPPQELTAGDVVRLAADPSASLPSSASFPSLLSLLDSLPSSVPAATYLSSLLSLLSRSPPDPSIPSFLSSLLLSSLRLNHPRLLSLFAPHLPNLDPSGIPALLDLIASNLAGISDFEGTHVLDLVPQLLILAVEASGEESIIPFLEKLLAVGWSKALLLKIASLLREFPILTRVRVSEFLEKVFKGMKAVDLQDLPSLVYQLLLLASKGLSKREVIRGVLGFFGGSLKGPPSIVRQVEGTVLMHVNFAVKQDPSLGQEVVAVIRSDLGVVNHFAIAVLLSVARVRRFSERSTGALRSAVVTSYRDYKVSRECKWLPDCLKEECLETAKRLERALMKAINDSNCGREHMVPSIVQFGFVLLESADGESGEELGVPRDVMGIEGLGIQILKTLFEVHEMARNEIIEQCKYRILSLKPQQSMPIIKLLGNLVQSYPYPMLEHVARLKELLDYFSFMHHRTANAFVNAILPLVKFSRELQDYIILVTRKAMFKREDTVRIAATTAMIELILMENRNKNNGMNSLQESSSQASCSQQAEISWRLGGGLFQELSGLLRRCLSQQDTMKEVVYQGLIKLVLLDPSVAGSVFDFLWPHFLQFYKEDADPPVRVDTCFKLEGDKVTLVERLDYLLSCVSWILLLQPHGKSDHPSEYSWPCFGFSLSQENEVAKASSGELFSKALSKIQKSLRKCSLEEGHCQSQDAVSLSQREKINCHGSILLGVIEVFINVFALELEKAEDEEKVALEEEIMALIGSYDSIEKDLSRNKQKTCNRKGSLRDTLDKVNNESKEFPYSSLQKLSQARRSLLATSSIHQLLLVAVKLYGVNITNNHTASQNHSQSSSCKAGDQCLKLISFVLKACHLHLKSITKMRSGLSGDPLDTLFYGDVKHLGQLIMQLVWLFSPGLKLEENPKKKEAKGKRDAENKGDQLLLALLCLNELFKVYSPGTQFTELMENLSSMDLPELDPENTMGAAGGINHDDLMVEDQHVTNIHWFLEKRIKPLYSRFIAISLFHESEVLAELVMIIGKSLPLEQRNVHGNWAAGICRRKRIEEPNATRSLVTLALYLIPAPNDLIVAHEMASQLLEVMGSEDKDSTEISETFPVINQLTQNTIANVLMQAVESSICDLDWAVSKLKAISVFNHEYIGDERNHQFNEMFYGVKLEEALYCRSESLVYVLSSYVEMNLKDSQAEQLLRVTARFYKLLARMTKLRIAPKGCKQLFPGQKFQKLAEVTSRRLTSPLYEFMALVLRNQEGTAQRRRVISKIKRENRCIPDLIYHIEDYEKYLILLSKLTKVNLLRHAKRSTARDFKILEAKKIAVEEVAPEHETTQASSASSEDESSEESESPDEDNICDKAVSPEGNGCFAAGDSRAEREDQEMVVRKKRARMSKIVEDSEEEA